MWLYILLCLIIHTAFCGYTYRCFYYIQVYHYPWLYLMLCVIKHTAVCDCASVNVWLYVFLFVIIPTVLFILPLLHKLLFVSVSTGHVLRGDTGWSRKKTAALLDVTRFSLVMDRNFSAEADYFTFRTKYMWMEAISSSYYVTSHHRIP